MSLNAPARNWLIPMQLSLKKMNKVLAKFCEPAARQGGEVNSTNNRHVQPARPISQIECRHEAVIPATEQPSRVNRKTWCGHFAG